MCCPCFKSKNPTILLDWVPPEKTIRQGIRELAERPIQCIFIKIENPSLPVVEISKKTSHLIYLLAKICFERAVKPEIFRINLGIICEKDPILQDKIANLELFDRSNRNANDEVEAQVIVMYKNNQVHSSKYVASALLDIFRIQFPTVSRESSIHAPPSIPSSSSGRLQHVISLGSSIEPSKLTQVPEQTYGSDELP